MTDDESSVSTAGNEDSSQITCSVCRVSVLPGAFCRQCGHPLVAEATPISPSPALADPHRAGSLTRRLVTIGAVLGVAAIVGGVWTELSTPRNPARATGSSSALSPGDDVPSATNLPGGSSAATPDTRPAIAATTTIAAQASVNPPTSANSATSVAAKPPVAPTSVAAPPTATPAAPVVPTTSSAAPPPGSPSADQLATAQAAFTLLAQQRSAIDVSKLSGGPCGTFAVLVLADHIEFYRWLGEQWRDASSLLGTDGVNTPLGVVSRDYTGDGVTDFAVSYAGTTDGAHPFGGVVFVDNCTWGWADILTLDGGLTQVLDALHYDTATSRLVGEDFIPGEGLVPVTLSYLPDNNYFVAQR